MKHSIIVCVCVCVFPLVLKDGPLTVIAGSSICFLIVICLKGRPYTFIIVPGLIRRRSGCTCVSVCVEIEVEGGEGGNRRQNSKRGQTKSKGAGGDLPKTINTESKVSLHSRYGPICWT